MTKPWLVKVGVLFIKKRGCIVLTHPPVAEREGFEPPVPCGTPVFKTGVFDHSTISPYK